MIWRQIVHWLLTSVQEKYKLRTCCVQKLFWMPKQKQKTIFVHSMFSTCIFLVLKSVINGQSVVILWVNWFKNKYFWHRFTCKDRKLKSSESVWKRNFVISHKISTHSDNFLFLFFQSAFYLEKQKQNMLLKKHEQSKEWTGFNIKTTSFVYWPNFQRRFR